MGSCLYFMADHERQGLSLPAKYGVHVYLFILKLTKGQIWVVGGLDLVCRSPVENPELAQLKSVHLCRSACMFLLPIPLNLSHTAILSWYLILVIIEDFHFRQTQLIEHRVKWYSMTACNAIMSYCAIKKKKKRLWGITFTASKHAKPDNISEWVESAGLSCIPFNKWIQCWARCFKYPHCNMQGFSH